MIPEVKELLLSEEQIQKRVAELGRQITEDYRGKEIVLVGVLKGAIVFFTDLARHIEGDVKGKHVIVVEDIVDTGTTLSYLLENLQSRKAASVRLCSLLNKPDRRKVDVYVDYEGFVIPDEFVIGYGLDYDEKYRQLPYIGILKEEVYQ